MQLLKHCESHSTHTDESKDLWWRPKRRGTIKRTHCLHLHGACEYLIFRPASSLVQYHHCPHLNFKNGWEALAGLYICMTSSPSAQNWPACSGSQENDVGSGRPAMAVIIMIMKQEPSLPLFFFVFEVGGFSVLQAIHSDKTSACTQFLVPF